VVVVTELAQAFDGDTWAPELGAGWRVAERDPATGWLPSRTGLDHRVITYLPAPAGHSG
jgi:dihydrofolate reductase